MRLPRTWKLVSLTLTLGAVACLWHFFAPTAIGGTTNYVVTDGISMEPRFHTGDLAAVRSQSTYHVGEIVAYYNKEFHTIVLHRIVGMDGARYVFKGDNNNFEDFEHPTRSQLIGALWLHIPGLGTVLDSVRSPALVGGLVALGVLLLGGGVFTQRRRRRRHAPRGARLRATPAGVPAVAGREAPRRLATPDGIRDRPTPHDPRPAVARGGAASAPSSLERLGGMLAVGVLALLPFALLALLAFTRPPDRQTSYVVPYEQTGTLSYRAQAPAGPAYANGAAETGEPLFTRVVNTTDLRFAYELHARGAHALGGTAALALEMASNSGWKTVLPLGSPIHFHGNTAVVSAPLELAWLEALVRGVADTTGVSDSVYSLTLLPQVSIGGSVSGLRLHTTFSQQAKFTLSPLELQPIVTPGTTGTALGESGPQSPASPNMFAQTLSGSVKGKRTEPLSLSFGVARLGVASARALALGGMGVVILLVLAAGVFVRPRPRDEAASILARYGRLIVPVARVAELPGVAVIDVADMDALARLAEHYDRSILHESSPAGEAFWVTDESGQFRYVIGAPAADTQQQAFDMAGEEPTREFAAARQDFPGAPPEGLATAAPESFLAAPPEGLATAAPESFPTAPPRSFPGEDRTAAFEWPPEQATDEVYEDELELAAIGYESGRATDRAKPSHTLLSLPAWSGWSG